MGRLAFGAGWAQRSRLWAGVVGVAVEVACVAGFYGQFLVGDVVDPKRLGFVDSTDALTLVGTAVSQWLWFIAPWVVVAVGAGVVYGMLGRWWGESRSIVAGVAIALPFIVEPAAWRVYVGVGQGPLVLWLAEVAVGIAILGWVIAARNRGQDPSPGPDRPDRAQAPRDLPQDIVADVVPVVVVDGLEAVEVEVDEAHRGPR